MPGSRGLLPTRFLPLPRCHRLRIDPLPALRRPRLLLQIPQHRLPAPVLLIPPCQPGANKFLVQVPPIRQDDLGGSAAHCLLAAAVPAWASAAAVPAWHQVVRLDLSIRGSNDFPVGVLA